MWAWRREGNPGQEHSRKTCGHSSLQVYPWRSNRAFSPRGLHTLCFPSPYTSKTFLSLNLASKTVQIHQHLKTFPMYGLSVSYSELSHNSGQHDSQGYCQKWHKQDKLSHMKDFTQEDLLFKRSVNIQFAYGENIWSKSISEAYIWRILNMHSHAVSGVTRAGSLETSWETRKEIGYR